MESGNTIDHHEEGITELHVRAPSSASTTTNRLRAEFDNTSTPGRLLVELDSGVGVTQLLGVLRTVIALAKGRRSVDRCAVLSDTRAVRRAVEALDRTLPIALRAYETSDRDNAMQWLRHPPVPQGIRLAVKPSFPSLLAEPRDALQIDDIELIETAVRDAEREGVPCCGVVVYAEKMPRWDSPGSLLRNLQLLDALRREGRRVALVPKSGPAAFAALATEWLTDGTYRYFPPEKLPDAMSWVVLQGAQKKPLEQEFDTVEEAGQESFPASDAPSYGR